MADDALWGKGSQTKKPPSFDPGASELMKMVSQFAPIMLLKKPVEAELLKRTVRAAVGEGKTIAADGARL